MYLHNHIDGEKAYNKEETLQMIEWKKIIYNHLEYYKNKELKIKNNGTYRNKEYGHILPKDQGDKNYFDDVASYVSDNKIKKHQNWYHLNSSQTMCLNFFVPLINKMSDFFVEVLNIEDVKVSESKFEYVPVNNSTNFDFYVIDQNKKEYFFEIKYTEDTITKKSNASNLDVAFKKYYKEEKEASDLFKKIDCNVFMQKHYQAYRNMVKAKGNNYSIFIVLRDNIGVNNEFDSALNDLGLKRETCGEKNILLFYWDDVVNKTIELVKDDEKLKKYYENFRYKYLDYKV